MAPAGCENGRLLHGAGMLFLCACGLQAKEPDGLPAYPHSAMLDWSRPMPFAPVTRAVGPAAADTIAVSDGASLSLRSVADGHMLWQRALPGRVLAPPLVTDDMVVVAAAVASDADVGGTLTVTGTGMLADSESVLVAYTRADASFLWGWRFAGMNRGAALALDSTGDVRVVFEVRSIVLDGQVFFETDRMSSCLAARLDASTGSIGQITRVGLPDGTTDSYHCRQMHVDASGNLQVLVQWYPVYSFLYGWAPHDVLHSLSSGGSGNWSLDVGGSALGVAFENGETLLSIDRGLDLMNDYLDAVDIVAVDAQGMVHPQLHLQGHLQVSTLARDAQGGLFVGGHAFTYTRVVIEGDREYRVFEALPDAGGGPLEWPTAAGLDQAAFLAHFSATGAHQWSQVFGGGGAELAELTLDGTGIVVQGTLLGPFDIGEQHVESDPMVPLLLRLTPPR